MSIELRLLSLSDEAAFYRAFQENWEESFDFVHYFESLAEKSFKKYVEIAPKFGKGELIPPEHVPSLILFAFNDLGEIIGRTSIRFELNDHLLKVGGHIGYGVCPSHRRKGYATVILKESLKYIKKNLAHIKKVLVTCDEGNIGSQKTIENNGGELENIIDIQGQPRKMRYWIKL